jgi:hypothetical protein
VLYSCEGCGIVDRPVDVVERNSDQNVVEWLHNVCVDTISKDHKAISPKCMADTIKTIKIPVAKESNNYLGKAQRQ